MDCDDGVAAVADEDVDDVELLELFEELLDEVPDVVAVVALVALDFVALVPELVVLDATDDVACVEAAITPVRASIPATLAAPTTRRDRRAGCGRRRFRGRAGGADPRGFGVVGWSLMARNSCRGLTLGAGGVSFWFR